MWPNFVLTHPTMDGITVKRLAVARIWQQARSVETNEQLGIARTLVVPATAMPISFDSRLI
jgi:hypothetical protein